MQLKRVLLLEDNVFQRSVTRLTLERLGIDEVLEASDGQQALEILRDQGHVPLVICDLRMSGMDGLGFLRHAAQGRAIGAVVICSEVELELRQSVAKLVEGLGLSYLGDLEKPYSLAKIKSILERVNWACTAESIGAIGVSSEAVSHRDMRHAFADKQFKAYFQPKFDIQAKAVAGAEVLVRWVPSPNKVVGPGVFLPVVRDSGLVSELFWSVFEQGLAVQKKLRQKGIQLPLAFNLDACQLTNIDLADEVQARLDIFQLPAEGITFELVEVGHIADKPVAMEVLLRLRFMGCGVSMDDFGEGLSSLRRLCELPFSEVKLDAGFLRGSGTQYRSVEVMRGAISMAREMGVDLVVEGVESQEHLNLIHSLGCRYAQGYLLSYPVVAEEMVELSGLEEGLRSVI